MVVDHNRNEDQGPRHALASGKSAPARIPASSMMLWRRSSCGSLAMLAAIRLASSRVGSFAGGVLSDAKLLTSSLDHLVGGHKQRGGHGETKRLRCLEIDGQFEFGRLADWNLAWLRALKNLADNVSNVVTVD